MKPLYRVPKLPSLPSYKGPVLVTLLSLAVCSISTALAMDGTAALSSRIFGTTLTVAAYTFSMQKIPSQLRLYLHPAVLSATLIYWGYAALAKATGEPLLCTFVYYGTDVDQGMCPVSGNHIIFREQPFNKMRFLLSSIITAVLGS